ncbi:MAG: hypothetical protein IKS41_01395 [Alphaproteobacteria bacterium]|nr:hypothetical protein [Alphaproteobacteria bacterium]
MADISKIKEALQNYTGEAESLNNFAAVAAAELGENWVETIYDTLTDLSAEEKEKLDHAFQYYAATMAWNEAQAYLNQTEPLDTAAVSARIPVLEHWLAFFQEAGLDVVNQLKQKLSAMGSEEAPAETDESSYQEEQQEDNEAEEEAQPAVEQKPEEKPIVIEKPKSEALWTVEKIKKQADMTKDIQSWVAARCVSLGNREVFAYPYYGFVVDVMRQTRKDIQSLLDSEEMLREVNENYPGEVRHLQDYQVSLDNDLEIAQQNGISDETALISDELTGDDARRVLGQLDTSNTPEFSGPAPDGFEVVLDTDDGIDDQQIKDEYNQIENKVLGDSGKNQDENEKNASQTSKNGVKKKLSFSLGNKKPAGT